MPFEIGGDSGAIVKLLVEGQTTRLGVHRNSVEKFGFLRLNETLGKVW